MKYTTFVFSWAAKVFKKISLFNLMNIFFNFFIIFSIIFFFNLSSDLGIRCLSDEYLSLIVENHVLK